MPPPYIILVQLLFSLVILPEQTSTVCLTSEELVLFREINLYREEKGLDPVPFSARLTLVAKAHAVDLANNYVVSDDNPCNLHSWSEAGEWKACCYTSDHRQARCMWNKPMEIAEYRGDGYEIAFYDSNKARAAKALRAWKNSPAHHPLLVNSGIWEKAVWKGMGVAIHEEYAVVWFGQLEDPSEVEPCSH